MKKMGDLMQEMGFRKDAPESLKEAFIKHLIKASEGVDVQTPSEKREAIKRSVGVSSAKAPEQLSFFDVAQNVSDSDKKVS